VFTVNTREEAEALITLACPKNYDNQHFAPELAEEQTIERLNDFSHRLDSIYKNFIQKSQPEEDGK